MKTCTKCHKTFDPKKEGGAFESTDGKHKKLWFCDEHFKEWHDFLKAYGMIGGEDDR